MSDTEDVENCAKEAKPLACCPPRPYPISGGTSETKPADEHVQSILDQVSDGVKEKSDGRDYSNLKAVNYKTQVVAGTNYFVKAVTQDGKNHVHLRIFKPLPCYGDKPELHSIEHDKTEEDELKYF